MSSPWANDADRVRARIAHLVSIESPSFDVEASRTITDHLAEWWSSVGADVSLVPSETGVHLVAELAGEGEPLMLVGHTDTVWPHGTLHDEVPWIVDGDILRGPGVYDMKSGLVVMLAAADRLRARAHRAARIVLVCDEEVGSPTAQGLLRDQAVGVSGVIGFESPHPDGALKVGRRGSTRVRLSVEGRAAHAALDPDAGISAIDELVDQLVAVRAIIADPALPSEVLCNVGTVDGGGRANVIPATASAEIGLRFIDGEAETRVLEALGALRPVREGARVHVQTLSHRPAWAPSPGDRELLKQIAVAAERVGQGATGRPAAGAGDANLLGSLGYPTVDGFGPRGGGAHAVSEHASLTSTMQRIDLLEALLAGASG